MKCVGVGTIDDTSKNVWSILCYTMHLEFFPCSKIRLRYPEQCSVEGEKNKSWSNILYIKTQHIFDLKADDQGSKCESVFYINGLDSRCVHLMFYPPAQQNVHMPPTIIVWEKLNLDGWYKWELS